MNEKMMKSSRVTQLRDLFQTGKPRPSEELGDIDLNKLMITKNMFYSKIQEQELPELNISSLKSISDLSEPNNANLIQNDIYRMHNDPSASDSDVDSPINLNSRNEIIPCSSNVYSLVKVSGNINGSTVSTLNRIDPFPGNAPMKVRPLGEEFRARRTFKKLQDKPNISNRKPSIISRICKSEDVITPLIIDQSSLDNCTKNNREKHKKTLPMTTKKVCNMNSSITPTIEKNLSTKTLNDKSDSDCDNNKKDLPQSIDSIDFAKVLLVDTIAKPTDVIYVDGNDFVSLPNSKNITTQSLGIPRNDYGPSFQDFLLDYNNFQIEEPMQAESVELEDFTTTEEEMTDDDENYVVASKLHDLDKNDIINNNDNIFNQIEFQQHNSIFKIESECHILEDGHFFYEKIVDVDDEADEELECQSVMMSSNDIITTYRRPGAKVHFNLNKVRVYSTYLAQEYDRKNEDIDPLVASAEYEMEKRLENMIIFPVDLYKGNSGLGISILGMGVGHSVGMKKLGIFVKSVITGGAAEEDGRICIYDQIVEVNGQSLVSVSQQYAASVLRNTHGMVHFLIGRERDQSSSEIVKLVEKSRQLSGLTSLSRMDTDENKSDSLNCVQDKTINLFQKSLYNKNVNDELYLQSQREDKNEIFSCNQSSTNSTDKVRTISTQTRITNLQSNEDLINIIIDDFNTKLHESKLKEEVMLNTISKYQNEANNYHILELESKSLLIRYAEIQSQLVKCHSDNLEKSQLIIDLSNKNKLLEEESQKSIIESQKIKGIYEFYNLRQSNGANQYSQEYQMDDQHNSSAIVDCTFDNVQLSKNDSSISKGESKNILGNMDNLITSTMLPDANDVFLNDADIFSEIRSTNSLLDNESAKNKAKLRKTSQISNRKPPTKSMMIGDDSNIFMCVNSQRNESNSSNTHMANNETIVSAVVGGDQNKYSTNISSKIIGGFALPGKNEIHLGIKPSTIIELKKTGKFNKNFVKDDLEVNQNEIFDHSQFFQFEREFYKDSVNTLKDHNDVMLKDTSMNSNLPTVLSHSLMFTENENSSFKNELYNTSPSEWDQNCVTKWLKLIGLTHIEGTLSKGGIINGYNLIRLDNERIKKVGIVSSNDRFILKKNIKELRCMIENGFDINNNCDDA